LIGYIARVQPKNETVLEFFESWNFRSSAALRVGTYQSQLIHRCVFGRHLPRRPSWESTPVQRHPRQSDHYCCRESSCVEVYVAAKVEAMGISELDPILSMLMLYPCGRVSAGKTTR